MITFRSIFVLAVLVLAGSTPTWASDIQQFSGELLKVGPGSYNIEGVQLVGPIAKAVLRACAVGQQCVVRGDVDHCPGIHGACLQMTRLVSANWGKDLPVCTFTAAQERANEWWDNDSSVLIRGTVHRLPSSDTAIVMDLSTCSSGAPMMISRVAEKWMGHYVEINGTALKSDDGTWSIIARAVKDVPE